MPKEITIELTFDETWDRHIEKNLPEIYYVIHAIGDIAPGVLWQIQKGGIMMRNELIEFGKWLKHLDNGTEHYDPETKQVSQSIGFSPWDCLTDDILSVEEIVDRYLKLQR